MEKKKYNVAIIGGGIVGISIAEKFLREKVKDIILLEKDPQILSETSSHNSGVIHGGFDATPGKLKAKLNVEGRLLYQKLYLKDDAKFSWKKVNSYILAYNQDDIKEINNLYNQGIANGLAPGEMAIIDKEEILAIDPNINPQVKKALVCYSSFLINPKEFGTWLHQEGLKSGLETKVNFYVTKINKTSNSWEIKNDKNETINADFIINASGVWGEELARLVEKKPNFKIDTRRGQYFILDKTQRLHRSENIFFLTPSKHGKGVIVAPQFDGRTLVGPNAEQGVPKTDIQLVTPEGLKYVRKIGKKINPKLSLDRVETVFAGSRSINILTNDFYLEFSKEVENFYHATGIQSPGLSSAPAIAKYVFEAYKKAKK